MPNIILELRKAGASFSHQIDVALTYTSDAPNNRTIVAYEVTFRASSSAGYSYSSNNRLWFSIGDNDISTNENVGSINLSAGGSKVLKSGSVVITHDADGTKSVAVKVRFKQQSTYDAEKIETVRLPDLSMASTITVDSYFDFILLDTNVTITVTARDSGFKNRLTYTFPSDELTHIYGEIGTNTGSGDIVWRPTLTDFGQYLRTVFTKNVLITCTTYKVEGGQEIEIGSNSITLPMGVPTYSNFSFDVDVEVVNPKLSEAVATFSGLKLTPTNINLQYGASLATVIYDQSNEMPVRSGQIPSLETGTLYQGGSIGFYVELVDSRGVRTLPKYVTHQVYPYSVPTLLVSDVFRCNSSGVEQDNGTYISVRSVATATDVLGNVIEQHRLRYRVVNTSNWVNFGSLTNGVNVLNVNFDAGTGYIVQVYATDTIGTTVYSREIAISSSGIPFNIRDSGQGVGLGKYCDRDNALEISESWTVYKGERLSLANRRYYYDGVKLTQNSLMVFLSYDNGAFDPWMQGWGHATVVDLGGLLQIDFACRIVINSKATSPDTYDSFGIGVANLKTYAGLEQSMSLIPLSGGVVTVYKPDGTVDMDINGYGMTTLADTTNGFWKIGRRTNASSPNYVGLLNQKNLPTDTYITGTIYASY